MSSRETILNAVRQAQPASSALPELQKPWAPEAIIEQYIEVLQKIGGVVIRVNDQDALHKALNDHAATRSRVISHLTDWKPTAGESFQHAGPHSFEDTDLLVMRSPCAVAENGAVWIDDQLMPQRVLPFITQHLAVVIEVSAIVPTMHEAYQFTAELDYGFGVFIAGPSKTADIEQSLVLGAHGPRTMTVYLVL